MANFRNYTTARRISLLRRGCDMQGVSAWHRPEIDQMGVDFTIGDSDGAGLICVTLTSEELDKLVKLRDGLRNQRDAERARKMMEEMGPGQ